YFPTLHFFFQAEDGIRDRTVTGVQTCALPISITGAISAERRCAAPTPEMAPVMVCVVLTGMPKCEAMNSVMAPLVSAQKPPNGVSLVRRWPMVLTIRQPPVTVPNPIAAPHATTTQAGMLLGSVRCSGDAARAPVPNNCCSATNRPTMMPMVFCASLDPCPSEYAAAEPIWS